jgi:hypothetical protein
MREGLVILKEFEGKRSRGRQGEKTFGTECQNGGKVNEIVSVMFRRWMYRKVIIYIKSMTYDKD